MKGKGMKMQVYGATKGPTAQQSCLAAITKAVGDTSRGTAAVPRSKVLVVSPPHGDVKRGVTDWRKCHVVDHVHSG